MSEHLSRRHFVLAAGAAATWLTSETASARNELIGKWKVQLQWPERVAVDVFWTVNSGGRFTSSDGFNGVWAQRGDLVVFHVNGGGEPSYAGNLSGTDMEGVSVERNGRRGFWSATLQP